MKKMIIKILKLFNLFLILIFFKFNENNFKFDNKILLNIKNINTKCLLLENNNKLYFNLTYIKYYFSFQFKFATIEYNLEIFDENKNLIYPSDLTLFKDLSIFCFIESKNNNKSIYSLAAIIYNRYFNCIEFISLNEESNFGILIYKNKEYYKYKSISFFTEKILNFKYLTNKNDHLFNPLIIIQEYISNARKMNNIKFKSYLKLKNSYIQYPFFELKRNAVKNQNEWKFVNLFNHYFCFCKGNQCLTKKIPQKCKFYFYINIINNNKNLYLKTDYIFVDLIFKELSSDDVYPVFKEMERQNYPVHYITEKMEIYKEYSYKIKNQLTIILIKKENYYNSGDFLEKYLTLLLKIKVVVSGKYTNLHSIANLFYNIEYITYIAVGHGVCFFKYYLYEDYRLYGRKRNDKILIPPSNKFINIAKKYGWKDDDIIKINLPRWDNYKFDNKKIIFINNKKNIKGKSIFMMFTWRDIYKNKKISSYYINNIAKLLENKSLNEELKNKKLNLYFTLHRYIYDKYKEKYKAISKNNKFIEYINQNEISNYLAKSQLIISDFSSIIFDFIYRRKPFILYIPDAYDPKIKDIYTNDYYYIIESFKKGTFNFENIYLEFNETIKKIIYYINNDFNLEPKLVQFYNSFNLKIENSIIKFINYLKNLK